MSAVRNRAGRIAQLVTWERGALLWIPAVLGATFLVLFGIRQAPAERYGFNHARELRIVLGPLAHSGVRPALAAAFQTALRQRLAARSEFALVDPVRVQQRLHLLGVPAHRGDPRPWMRATRNLNARYWLNGRLRTPRGGRLVAEIEVWEVAREAPGVRWVLQAPRPDDLAAAVADSLVTWLFVPTERGGAAALARTSAHAARP